MSTSVGASKILMSTGCFVWKLESISNQSIILKVFHLLIVTLLYYIHNTKTINFFLEKNDTVRCFSCNLGLAEWNPKDNPWIEHARHNPKCWFLKAQKGQTFIDNIQQIWKEASI